MVRAKEVKSPLRELAKTRQKLKNKVRKTKRKKTGTVHEEFGSVK